MLIWWNTLLLTVIAMLVKRVFSAGKTIRSDWFELKQAYFFLMGEALLVPLLRIMFSLRPNLQYQCSWNHEISDWVPSLLSKRELEACLVRTNVYQTPILLGLIDVRKKKGFSSKHGPRLLHCPCHLQWSWCRCYFCCLLANIVAVAMWPIWNTQFSNLEREMTGGPTNASCSNFCCFVFRARFLIMLYKCILKQMATTFLERIQSTQQETNCFELCNRLVIKILTSRRDWVIIVQKNLV